MNPYHWTYSKDRHPDAKAAACGIVGYTVRNFGGQVVAEIFTRAQYPVVVTEESARLIASAPALAISGRAVLNACAGAWPESLRGALTDLEAAVLEAEGSRL